MLWRLLCISCNALQQIHCALANFLGLIKQSGRGIVQIPDTHLNYLYSSTTSTTSCFACMSHKVAVAQELSEFKRIPRILCCTNTCGLTTCRQ